MASATEKLRRRRGEAAEGYERRRRERIRQNNAKLRSLGLAKISASLRTLDAERRKGGKSTSVRPRRGGDGEYRPSDDSSEEENGERKENRCSRKTPKNKFQGKNKDLAHHGCARKKLFSGGFTSEDISNHDSDDVDLQKAQSFSLGKTLDASDPLLSGSSPITRVNFFEDSKRRKGKHPEVDQRGKQRKENVRPIQITEAPAAAPAAKPSTTSAAAPAAKPSTTSAATPAAKPSATSAATPSLAPCPERATLSGAPSRAPQENPRPRPEWTREQLHAFITQQGLTLPELPAVELPFTHGISMVDSVAHPTTELQPHTKSTSHLRRVGPSTTSHDVEDNVYSTHQPVLPLLELDETGNFKLRNKISAQITKVFCRYNRTVEYRWSHLHHEEQEIMFDTLLSRFTLMPGTTKEDYRQQFTELIKKRMTDIYHKARKAALEKVVRDEGAADDYQAAKAYRPYWSTVERWGSLCDLFSSDASFKNKSEAGKRNREKQEVRSNSGSKSHYVGRGEMEKQHGEDSAPKDWWFKTHNHKGDWSTPAAKELYVKYQSAYHEKYADVEEDKCP